MGSGRAAMTDDLENIRRLKKKLRENLVKCADDPGVDPVHDTRTGTRRLQATLEDLLREIPIGDAGEPVRSAVTATMRLLKKIRREAGPVRDLDVHRKLMEKLTKRALNPTAGGMGENGQTALSGKPDVIETPEASLRTTGLEQQADDL